MLQNKYDDPDFFNSYSQMPRSTGGLESAGEWPYFRALLPEIRGKRVLDLGCGFGWHCRYVRAQGAQSVIGVDLSANMLARALELTDDPAIEYRQGSIEEFTFQPAAFDVVISSLAFHYVADYAAVCRCVHESLTSGGAFVFSVEHPIFTARAAQDWNYGPNGERLHWPVDNYQDEGARRTQWLADDVVKYHRTIATYFNTLLDNGFRITRVIEPRVSPEQLAENPELQDENRRPMFLLIAAQKAT